MELSEIIKLISLCSGAAALILFIISWALMVNATIDFNAWLPVALSWMILALGG